MKAKYFILFTLVTIASHSCNNNHTEFSDILEELDNTTPFMYEKSSYSKNSIEALETWFKSYEYVDSFIELEVLKWQFSTNPIALSNEDSMISFQENFIEDFSLIKPKLLDDLVQDLGKYLNTDLASERNEFNKSPLVELTNYDNSTLKLHRYNFSDLNLQEVAMIKSTLEKSNRDSQFIINQAHLNHFLTYLDGIYDIERRLTLNYVAIYYFACNIRDLNRNERVFKAFLKNINLTTNLTLDKRLKWHIALARLYNINDNTTNKIMAIGEIERVYKIIMAQDQIDSLSTHILSRLFSMELDILGKLDFVSNSDIGFTLAQHHYKQLAFIEGLLLPDKCGIYLSLANMYLSNCIAKYRNNLEVSNKDKIHILSYIVLAANVLSFQVEYNMPFFTDIKNFQARLLGLISDYFHLTKEYKRSMNAKILALYWNDFSVFSCEESLFQIIADCNALGFNDYSMKLSLLSRKVLDRHTLLSGKRLKNGYLYRTSLNAILKDTSARTWYLVKSNLKFLEDTGIVLNKNEIEHLYGLVHQYINKNEVLIHSLRRDIITLAKIAQLNNNYKLAFSIMELLKYDDQSQGTARLYYLLGLYPIGMKKDMEITGITDKLSNSDKRSKRFLNAIIISILLIAILTLILRYIARLNVKIRKSELDAAILSQTNNQLSHFAKKIPLRLSETIRSSSRPQEELPPQLLKLSSFFDAFYSYTMSTTTDFQKELELCKTMVDIEFQDIVHGLKASRRIILKSEIIPPLKSMPKLVFFNILYNSFEHGRIAETTVDGKIYIKIEQIKKRISFIFSDTGVYTVPVSSDRMFKNTGTGQDWMIEMLRKYKYLKHNWYSGPRRDQKKGHEVSFTL